MDDAISLLNRWLDAEYAASVAMWRERDDTRYDELLADVSRNVAKTARILFEPHGRINAEMDDFEGDDVEGAVADLKRRTLFATAIWRHPEHGLVLTAYTDWPSKQLTSSPVARLHMLLDRSPPQLVGREARCALCASTGKRNDAVCGECRGAGWTGYRGNLELGRVVNVGQAQLHVPREQVDERGELVLGGLGL